LVLRIRKYGDSILSQRAQPVLKITPRIKRLIEDMKETLAAVEGVGLAAPQVGELSQIVVINLSTKEKKRPILTLINPEILKKEGKIVAEEGCLSLPGITVEVKRAKKITLKFYNEELKEITTEAEELFARICQHEIDHLRGILVVDRLPPAQRKLVQRKLKKIKKKGEVK
jgi:peptide deformylase